jgi:hypothetical protein
MHSSLITRIELWKVKPAFSSVMNIPVRQARRRSTAVSSAAEPPREAPHTCLLILLWFNYNVFYTSEWGRGHGGFLDVNSPLSRHLQGTPSLSH